jgi:hypothetical protein
MTGLSLNGNLLWDHPFEAAFEQTMLTPVVWKDLVLVGGEGKPTVALRIEKRDGILTPSQAWSNPQLRSYLTTPVMFRDHVVGHNYPRRELVCVSLATGRTAWTQLSMGKHASIIRAGTDLLVLTYEGELHVLEAKPEKFIRKARWKLPVKGPVWAHLSVAGSRLYVKDHTDLHCFDLGTR